MANGRTERNVGVALDSHLLTACEREAYRIFSSTGMLVPQLTLGIRFLLVHGLSVSPPSPLYRCEHCGSEHGAPYCYPHKKFLAAHYEGRVVPSIDQKT